MVIYLLGFMGCGKTTFGKKLAACLGYKFIDTDKRISEKYHMDIPAFFSQYGQERFRLEENKLLLELAEAQDGVVSTGGGLPCYHNNMQLMNSMGLTVYMQMEPAVLAKRLESGKDKRPLLAGVENSGLEAYIKEKLAEREHYYKQAQLTINAVTARPEEVAGILRKHF